METTDWTNRLVSHVKKQRSLQESPLVGKNATAELKVTNAERDVRVGRRALTCFKDACQGYMKRLQQQERVGSDGERALSARSTKNEDQLS